MAEHNIRANGLSHLTLDRRAVGGSAGEALNLGNTLVKTVTLDDACREHRIAEVRALKVDVDGGDLDVLVGARQLLGEHRPLVVVEMHDKQQGIYDLLQETGYRYLVGMRGERVSPGAWPPNMFASMEEVRIPPRGALSA
ncbi:MAG TPA: FkbM family methyltransferase [Chthonomonadales bacterium]|nr:FkbM family methyltransferase [Chthonomonadales bacterium]